MERPDVIRLVNYVRIPREAHRRKITRRAVLARDDWTCQYCGSTKSGLTVDHVIPRSRGGLSVWENIVAACAPATVARATACPARSRCTRRRRRRRRRPPCSSRSPARRSRPPGSSTCRRRRSARTESRLLGACLEPGSDECEGRRTQRVVAACAFATSLIVVAIAACGASAASGIRSSRPPPARPTTSGRWRGCGRRKRSSWAAQGPGCSPAGGQRPPWAKPHRIAARLRGPSARTSNRWPTRPPPSFRVNGAVFLSFGHLRLRPLLGHRPPPAATLSVVITAGHCVNSGGRRRALVQRQEASSSPPTATASDRSASLPVRWIDSTKQWRANGSENFDVGAMVVGTQ